MNRKLPFAVLVLLSLGLPGCVTNNPEALAEHDPFEPTNRFFFDATQKLDRAILKPIAKGYVAVVPAPAREGLHNVLTDINQPVVMGNEILQGSPGRAASTLGRFVVNSTVGVGGAIDVATKLGIPSDDQDGGVTLGKWGMSEGPYFFAPFVGPAPPRDLLGRGMDVALQPLTWIKFPGSKTLTYSRLGLGILDERAQTLDQLDQIERTSIDFYATTRSLYRQSRAAQINGGKANLQTLPNF
jgi:phospholipid-binding lipoprotein MlaA